MQRRTLQGDGRERNIAQFKLQRQIFVSRKLLSSYFTIREPRLSCDSTAIPLHLLVMRLSSNRPHIRTLRLVLIKSVLTLKSLITLLNVGYLVDPRRVISVRCSTD